MASFVRSIVCCPLPLVAEMDSMWAMASADTSRASWLPAGSTAVGTATVAGRSAPSTNSLPNDRPRKSDGGTGGAGRSSPESRRTLRSSSNVRQSDRLHLAWCFHSQSTVSLARKDKWAETSDGPTDSASYAARFFRQGLHLRHGRRHDRPQRRPARRRIPRRLLGPRGREPLGLPLIRSLRIGASKSLNGSAKTSGPCGSIA